MHALPFLYTGPHLPGNDFADACFHIHVILPWLKASYFYFHSKSIKILTHQVGGHLLIINSEAAHQVGQSHYSNLLADRSLLLTGREVEVVQAQQQEHQIGSDTVFAPC